MAKVATFPNSKAHFFILHQTTTSFIDTPFIMPEDPIENRPDPTSIRIRTYEPKDYSAAMEMIITRIASYPENRKEIQPNWVQLIQATMDGDMADVEGYYFALGGHYWVATCPQADGTEKVVGMIAIKTHDKNVAELRRFFVHQAYHRRGIGRLLMQTFESHVQQKKYKHVWLLTPSIAQPAHALYESFGYRHMNSKILPVGLEVIEYEKQWVGTEAK